MRVKLYMTVLIVASILMVLFGATPVSASGEGPQRFTAPHEVEASFVPDEVVVKFKNDNQPFRVIKVPQGKVAQEAAWYSHRPDVIYAEPNYCAQATLDPNDPYYQIQWDLEDTDHGGIDMGPAWTISTGAGVIVAVVDTGIAFENYGKYMIAPDLGNTHFVPGYDFVNNDSHPNDDNSHGTHVAGTIAQSTNNSIGTAGVAYDATLMPVKVLDKNGSGTYTAIADGIYFAADHGAQVINMSLGGSSPSTTLENALQYAYGKGVTIVAAAGNDGTSRISYPAAYDDYVIAVGATRCDKTLASYSNYGASLDLVAPGGDLSIDQNGDGYADGILQNTFNPSTKRVSDFGYWFFQGTSMASPHVAGVAALVIAHKNATSPDDVRSALEDTAFDLGTSGRDNTYGYGLVNANAALSWTTEPSDNIAPTAVGQGVTTNEDTPVAITLTATDPDADDTLDYFIVSGPSNGSLSGTAPNVTYTPNTGYSGPDYFTFKAYDGTAYSDIATVTITVNPVDNPPPPPPTQTLTLSIHMSTGNRSAGKNLFCWAEAMVDTGVDGATVQGHWQGAVSDSDIGVTNSLGSVAIQSDSAKRLNDPLTFTFVVDSVTRDGVTFALTGDPEGTITIP